MTNDMTTGSPLRRILAFCAPLLVGNLFQQFYNLADSILVGRILGVKAFAAVGSTGALSFLILGFALGICSGFAIPVSQSFGAGDIEGLKRRCGQLVWLGLGFSAAITALTFFLTDDILRWTNTPAELFDDAYTYIFIVFMGTGATILYNLTSAVLRAIGDSRTPLHFLMAAVTVNVVLDIVFMKFLGLGVEGAAWATVLSQLLSGLLCLQFIYKKQPMLRLTKDELAFSWRSSKYILSVGVPMGLQFSITAVGSIILQSAVNGLGASAVAAVSAASRVHNIVQAPLDTSGMGMATYCGQNLGAAQPRRIRQGIADMCLLDGTYCVFAILVNAFFGTTIATLFIDSGEVAVMRLLEQYLIIQSLFYPALAVIYIFRNGLQGMGYSRQAMLAGVFELVARVGVAFGFVSRFGFDAVCYANPAAWIFADSILLFLYVRAMKQLNTPFGPVPERLHTQQLKKAQH